MIPAAHIECARAVWFKPATRIARLLAAIGVTAQSVSLDASEYFRLLDPANIGELETLAATHPELHPVLAMAREDAEAERKPPPVDPPMVRLKFLATVSAGRTQAAPWAPVRCCNPGRTPRKFSKATRR